MYVYEFNILDDYYEGSFRICAETLEQAQEVAKTIKGTCIVYTDGGKIIEGLEVNYEKTQIITENIKSI